MTIVSLTIDTSNDAFGPAADIEVGRILRRAADRIEAGGLPGRDQVLPLRDINGNTVGEVTILPEDD